MSVSNIKERVYDIEIAGLRTVLPEFVFRWQLAGTAEAKVAIEGEAMAWIEQLLDDSIPVPLVKEGDSLILEDALLAHRRYVGLTQLLRGSFQALTDLYIQYENTKKVKLLDITAKLKRIQQKKASLSFGQGEVKYALIDSFFNQDWLIEKFLSDKVCALHPAQGIVTLPIQSKVQPRIKSVIIGAGSNGSPGNSDVVVDTTIGDTSNILDGSDSTWFEYERMDTGPCRLVLNFELEASQILNSLQLVAANLSGLSTFEIEDIVFSDSGTESISIKKLVNKDLPKSFWSCNGSAADGYWDVVFLPVKAKTFSLQLLQRTSTKITTVSADLRHVSRDRYGLGIKEVRAFSSKYVRNGQLGSVAREYPAGLFLAQGTSEVHPPSPDLYNLYFETSLDDGASWSQRENIDSGKTKALFLEGEGGDILWRIGLERQDESFQFLSSLFSTEKTLKHTESLLKSFSRFNSPVSIALKEKPSEAKVFLMQPKIARRGDRLSAVPIHRNMSLTSAVKAPINLLNSTLDVSAFHLFVNGTEYSLNEDNTSLGVGEWSFSDDYEELLFADDLSVNTQVRFVLDPELMVFEQRADGYFHRSEFLFDPDKKNIKIAFLSKDTKRLNRLLPRDKRIIPLGVQFIEDDSIKVTSSDGTELDLVSSRADVVATTDCYVDSINGVLYLQAESAEEQYRISLNHHTPVIFKDENYEIVYDNLKPVGILIGASVFEAKTMTETASNVTEKVVNPITGVYETRDALFPSTVDALTLSEKPVVRGTLTVSSDFIEDTTSPEETVFIDGYSEFLGLIEMNRETTPAAEADGSGLISFTLAAGALWFSAYAVVFEDTDVFSNLLGSVPTGGSATGDYYVSSTGVVTVKAPAGITEQQFSYFYKDPYFNPDRKYSVDYLNGRVYSYANMNSAASVTYKVATYIMSYDVAEEIKDFTYDSNTNTVSVKTEGLREMNNLIKVIWEKSQGAAQIAELKDYFSPLLTSISLEFA